MATARMKAQKRLNGFVRIVAFMERTGNAVGRLVLIWATVVVGFSKKLHSHFGYLAAIIILESFRAFSRESKSDDQLLFKITGSITVTRMPRTIRYFFYAYALMFLIYIFGVIIFFFGLFRLYLYFVSTSAEEALSFYIPVASEYADPLVLVPLVLPINFQIPLSMTRIVLGFLRLFGGEYGDLELEDSNNGTHVVKTLKALYIMVICQGALYILACVFEAFSFFFRASLALRCGLVDKMGMKSIDLYYEHAYETFVQESVLDIKKMSLVTFAVDSVNSDVTRDKKLAAVQILNSFLQQEDEASNKEVASQVTSSTKAVSTLISMLGWTVPEGASPTEDEEVVKDADVRLFAAKVVADLAGYLRIVGIPGTIQMVSSLLDAENKPARQDSLAPIVEGNGGSGDQEIRDASSSPGVDGNRGTVDNEETGYIRGIGDQEITDALIPSRVDGNRGTAGSPEIEFQEMSQAAAQAGDLERGNADNQPPIQDSSVQASGISEGSSRIHRFFLFFQNGGIWICNFQKHMKDILSIPRDSLKDEDSIPVLGVLILERLAYDVDNCAEISRSTEILPKIIGFISHITDTTTSQQKQIVTSSLILVAKLASVKGEIGVTLRKCLSENHLLLSKLAEILEDSCSGPEQWKPTMDIIAKLAMDEKASQEIGGNQVIIATLIHTFLGRDESPNTSNDPLLRKAAGEALAMLSIENAGNCSAMLNEPGYELIRDLMDMLLIRDPDGEYVYLAAILLQSMCMHSGRNLRHDQNPNQPISSALSTVLERIINPDSEGKQLEALIGLASQICTLFPGSITHPHIPRPDDGVLAKKLVDELNANKRPSTEIPNMRRRLVELAISMVTLRPVYAEAFRNNGMLEALSIVERTPSKVGRYRLFSGSVGLFPQLKEDRTLSDLAADAKGLMIGPAAQAAQVGMNG